VNKALSAFPEAKQDEKTKQNKTNPNRTSNREEDVSVWDGKLAKIGTTTKSATCLSFPDVRNNGMVARELPLGPAR